MIQKIFEPDTCKYSMDGVTVDTESQYELCFDFADSNGIPHHINATELAVIKESFHTQTWDVFVVAHNDYANTHERYNDFRLRMLHELTHDDCSYTDARDLIREFSLLAVLDNRAEDTRAVARNNWLQEYRDTCYACNAPVDTESLLALGSKWLSIEENTLYNTVR